MGKSLPYLGCKLASSAYSSATDVTTFLMYLNALIKVLLDRMATHCPVHMCHYRGVFCWVWWAFPRHLCSQVLPVPKMLCTWLAMQQVQVSICSLEDIFLGPQSPQCRRYSVWQHKVEKKSSPQKRTEKVEGTKVHVHATTDLTCHPPIWRTR